MIVLIALTVEVTNLVFDDSPCGLVPREGAASCTELPPEVVEVGTLRVKAGPVMAVEPGPEALTSVV